MKIEIPKPKVRKGHREVEKLWMEKEHRHRKVYKRPAPKRGRLEEELDDGGNGLL